jgi:tRNA(Met) cytidine acetyltransferase
LLDDPGLSLWVARHGRDLCGVVLGAVEGGFDDAIAALILAGRRRPHGHLLAQSLAVHAGFDQALSQRTLRVVRIAVHPAQQRRGIGRRLLVAARAWAVSERLDGLGCAFGSASDLLAFWTAQGLEPVRLGLRIDPASAAHALMMLDGLSAGGRSLATAAVARFRRDLPWSLGDEFSDLPPELAIALLRGRGCADLPLDTADLTGLARIAAGARQPATATPVIWRWLVRVLSDGAAGLEPLVARYLQHWPMRRVCETYGIAGGAALAQQLRGRLADAENASRPNG